jgi:hypothetical protein
MHHCLSKIFGRSVSSSVAGSQIVSGPIILHDGRMVYGNISSALFEVAHRITASLHYIANQAVRLSDRRLRLIDEACLNAAPEFRESSHLGWCQITELKLFNTLLSFQQLLFGFARISLTADYSVVFRAEPIAKAQGSLLLYVHENRYYDSSQSNYNQNSCHSIHSFGFSLQASPAHEGDVQFTYQKKAFEESGISSVSEV